MIGKLNHIAIVVADLDAAAERYRNLLGTEVSEPLVLPDHGVTTIFVTLPNTRIELLHPLGSNSPIQRFLDRRSGGGMHHVCYEVQDIHAAITRLQTQGIRVLDPVPRIGAHGKPVVFLHPGDWDGTLVELEEA